MIYALRGQYENELLHLGRFISPGMVVVDGGANCGIYTVAAAKLVGTSGLILSFEPGAEAFAVLRKNVVLNGLTNVRTYRAALSDKEGTAALYHHRGGPNSFSLGATGAGGEAFEEVVTRTLFQVVREETALRLGLRPFGSWKLLESLGYGFFSLTERGELCELKQPPTGNDAINVVAIHRMEGT